MVCLVRDRNNYLPSCSALVQEGMEIDASSEDVVTMRCKAIELLLVEHRAECEAQCRIVCPAGYNIPKMNRLLIAGNIQAASELSLSETGSGEIRCLTCSGYCENACRRKKIDIPVSIKNLQLFVFHKLRTDNHVQSGKPALEPAVHPKVRFSSRIGKVEPGELQEWLKECKTDIKRTRQTEDIDSAVGEAAACMHCDCHASSDCRLRDHAELLKVKDPKGKIINAPIEKKINYKTGMIFENAKCIKCGLCVRLCEDLGDDKSLCFLNRGFVSIISEPLTEEFSDILKSHNEEVIAICPTGALSKME
jgi:predicted molibdopterin-dependent oxidoreductase YjgC